MTIPKLFQWLLGLGSFMSIWLAYVFGIIEPTSCRAFHDVILVCFSVAVIGYRVATFNDCKEAAKELQEQIKDAQRDLEKKGFKYASDWKQ